MQRVLLDTQVWLWMNTQPARIGPAAMSCIRDADCELILSAASSWEIAIKYGLGKLPLPEPPDRYVPDRIQATGVVPVAVEHAHTLHVATLAPIHRDPFDRILIAQSLLLDAPLVTADEVFAGYAVEVVPA